MVLTVYTTRQRKKTVFTPRNDKRVRLFVCGPTVYDYSHIGHARTYVAFDVIARYLRYRGYEVFYLQNITDLDDKIINRAREEGVRWKELADTYTRAYLEDMRALNITSVTKYAPATQYIAAMVMQVSALIEKGYAYELDDGIYYDVSHFEDYGRLSGRTAEEAEDTASRIDEGIGKRNKADFCLWKRFKPGEPYWESALGRGRPGWHIEDTAITETEFGSTYDMHGGAQDLIFPHHEAEIAQMEAISGQKPMVNYWLHTGFLKVEGRKMSKSLGNFITIRDALKKWDADTLRLMLVSTHYRSPINYAETSMEYAQESLRSIRTTAKSGRKRVDVKTWLERFVDAMDDDFNTPKVVALLLEMAKRMNKTGEDLSPAIFEIGDILSIDFRAAEKPLPPELMKLIKRREELRERGILLNDTPEGTEWVFKNHE